MAAYVLIHGAWHGGWCWDKVAELLRKAGHSVAAPDLPGHGADTTPLDQITLDSYVDRALEALDVQPEPAILAGHSMGGLVITQAAERRPEQIKALVYVTAFIPRNGETLGRLSMADPESLLNQNRVVDHERGIMGVRREALRDVFYHDCSDEDAARAESLLVPAIAIKPNTTPVETTADRFGRIPKYYVECLQDRAIRLPTQRLAHQNTPCRRVFSLESAHSPFLSVPDELTRCLLAVAE